jgi:glycosyltransferase involved in cell wall biosynthesis
VHISTELLIVSSAVHYIDNGVLFGYGPYVREINIWSDLFPHIVLAAPCRRGQPPGDYLPLPANRVSIHPITEAGGNRLSAKIKQIGMLPKLIMELWPVMKDAGAIHVRCPGNLGLIAVALAPFVTNRRIAKYAGQWDGYPGEAWTVAVQRRLLGSRWWGAPVTVYGSYSRQPEHVISFFTSILDDSQIDRAVRSARGRVPTAGTPLRVLYVGRLSRPKNVDVLIQAVARVHSDGVPVACTIVGTGPELTALRKLAAECAARSVIQFIGAVEHDQVLEHYERADALVLTSDTEGWPKAIAEGMAFGLVCIGSNRGFIRQMLGENRGLTVAPRDVHGITSHLRNLAQNPQDFIEMRRAAAHWSQKFSLSGLREALKALLDARWGHLPPTHGKGSRMSPPREMIA